MADRPHDGAFRGMRHELQHTVLSNLTILSLLGGRAHMPDPVQHRGVVHALLRRLQEAAK
jgi:hypothetical protein